MDHLSASLAEQACNPQVKPKKSFGQILYQAFENIVLETSWKHVAFKICAFTYLGFVLWIGWTVSPWSSIWHVPRQTDGIPLQRQNFENYFNQFEGYPLCGIEARDLYAPPVLNSDGLWPRAAFCETRDQLLEAMSNGGRHGFDAPYTPKGCHYRWYILDEICAILDRFDGLVFVGDAALQNIFNGFSILLRKDLAFGALKSSEMSRDELSECQCDHQFTDQHCSRFFTTSSAEGKGDIGGHKPQNIYTCPRVPYNFLSVDTSPAAEAVIDKLKSLMPSAPPSKYRPIPIIHSLTRSNDISLATASLTEFLQYADASKRNTPMLWIGPAAAGHTELKGRKGNQEIWQFDRQMKHLAGEKDVDVLGMWNMTVQAKSWDGLGFGEHVALVQAMMVINWLSRLPSS